MENKDKLICFHFYRYLGIRRKWVRNLLLKWKKDPRSYIDCINTQLKQLRKESQKKSGLNGNQTHDLCDAGAVLYQLSYQANWELVIL